MQTKTALKFLAAHHALVFRRGSNYRATVPATGAVIMFSSRAGRVTSPRVWRPGRPETACRTVVAALQTAMTKAKVIPRPAGLPLLLSLAVERRAPDFAPVASVMVFDMGDGPTYLGSGSAEWSDPEAVELFTSAIDGNLPDRDLLDWLTGRGGEVAGAVGAARQSDAGPPG